MNSSLHTGFRDRAGDIKLEDSTNNIGSFTAYRLILNTHTQLIHRTTGTIRCYYWTGEANYTREPPVTPPLSGFGLAAGFAIGVG
ncbi:hypothetical protein M378DRAFT_11898 [Amanita muscaria Koide BX008]|uniref:Uncharacterized protein n=1 Tax=Amanita muscaria (strain Koide BX008) TaxID=946122 RepID=A0A0C2TAR8_AMAMK|nr:hypothetical protein M378DRAFT_11898 [Amanita muscaria Koide BX008]